MTAALIAMRARGKTLREIARALGVSHSVTVAKAVLGKVMTGRLLPRRRAVLRDVRRLPGEPEPLGAAAEIPPEGVCRWITGDAAGGAWRMCGHPCVLGGAWCAHHRARVYESTLCACPSSLEGEGQKIVGGTAGKRSGGAA